MSKFASFVGDIPPDSSSSKVIQTVDPNARTFDDAFTMESEITTAVLGAGVAITQDHVFEIRNAKLTYLIFKYGNISSSATYNFLIKVNGSLVRSFSITITTTGEFNRLDVFNDDLFATTNAKELTVTVYYGSTGAGNFTTNLRVEGYWLK